MAEPSPGPWTVDQFFAWQERQAERYELVDGSPLRMTVGARNVHDDVIVNIIAALGNQLRGKRCRPFTGESSMETLSGQIRRPDIGIDCGLRDPNGFKAAEPRMVLEVLSPGTRDFHTLEKIWEYKTVETLDHIVFVDPDCAEVVHWTRTPDRGWERRVIEDLDGTLDLADLGVTLPLREIYDDVSFPPSLRPRLVDDRPR